MFLSFKTLSFIFLITILFCANSCVEREIIAFKVKGTPIGEICETLDGEWIFYKINDGNEDCRQKSCRTGVGMMRFKCDSTKISVEHFVGEKDVLEKEKWDEVTTEISDDKITFSVKILDKKNSNTVYRATYEFVEVKDNRLFGKYKMQQVSNDRVVHETRFIAQKKLRTWKRDKP